MKYINKVPRIIVAVERIHTIAALTMLFLWELRHFYMLLFREQLEHEAGVEARLVLKGTVNEKPIFPGNPNQTWASRECRFCPSAIQIPTIRL